MTAREELLHHRTSAALLSPCRASIWRTADERFWYLEPLRRTAGAGVSGSGTRLSLELGKPS
jgi:uncharacterized protein (DUF302 family)